MAEAQLTNQLTRIDSMTNVELRAELKRRGCPTSGNKKDLLAKLRVALQKEYEQTALETASTVSTMDSMSFDGRNNNMSGLQQSPVVPFDVSRPMLNNSTASSNSYMTPHGGSPITYAQQMHSGEAPLTYNNLQMHDQVKERVLHFLRSQWTGSFVFDGVLTGLHLECWTICVCVQFIDAPTYAPVPNSNDPYSSAIDDLPIGKTSNV